MRANRSTLAKLCLLTALAVPVQRTASAAEASRAVQQLVAVGNTQLVAQTEEAPQFSPPASLASGTLLRIDGSTSMKALNEALAEQFLARYDGAKVDSEVSSTDAALSRLQSGDIDLAAIGRPLKRGRKAGRF